MSRVKRLHVASRQIACAESRSLPLPLGRIFRDARRYSVLQPDKRATSCKIPTHFRLGTLSFRSCSFAMAKRRCTDDESKEAWDLIRAAKDSFESGDIHMARAKLIAVRNRFPHLQNITLYGLEALHKISNENGTGNQDALSTEPLEDSEIVYLDGIPKNVEPGIRNQFQDIKISSTNGSVGEGYATFTKESKLLEVPSIKMKRERVQCHSSKNFEPGNWNEEILATCEGLLKGITEGEEDRPQSVLDTVAHYHRARSRELTYLRVRGLSKLDVSLLLDAADTIERDLLKFGEKIRNSASTISFIATTIRCLIEVERPGQALDMIHRFREITRTMKIEMGTEGNGDVHEDRDTLGLVFLHLESQIFMSSEGKIDEGYRKLELCHQFICRALEEEDKTEYENNGGQFDDDVWNLRFTESSWSHLAAMLKACTDEIVQSLPGPSGAETYIMKYVNAIEKAEGVTGDEALKAKFHAITTLANLKNDDFVETLIEQILEMKTMSPSAIEALFDTAKVLYEMGRLGDAEDLMRKCIMIRGDKSNEPLATATILNDLGMILLESGEVQSALEELKKSVGIKKKFLKSDHPDLANGYHNLGQCLMKTRDFDYSEISLWRAVHIYRTLCEDAAEEWEPRAMSVEKLFPEMGPRSPKNQNDASALLRLATVMGHLGELYFQRGGHRLELAEHAISTAIRIKCEAVGTGAKQFLLELNNLATVLVAKQDYNGAIKTYQKLIELMAEQQGENSSVVAVTKFWQANAFVGKSDLESAADLMEEALVPIQQLLPKPKQRFFWKRYSEVLIGLGRTSEAKEAEKKCV